MIDTNPMFIISHPSIGTKPMFAQTEYFTIGAKPMFTQ